MKSNQTFVFIRAFVSINFSLHDNCQPPSQALSRYCNRV